MPGYSPDPTWAPPWPAVAQPPESEPIVIPYRLDEADILIPASWQDQSINIFKLPAGGGAREASFVVSRDPSQGDVAFMDYVTTQLANAAKQLPDFVLKDRWDLRIHEHNAVLVDYTWRRDGRLLMLRQTFIERKPAVLITTLTTTPEDFAWHEPAWKAAMQSIKPLPAAPTPPPAPAPLNPLEPGQP